MNRPTIDWYGTASHRAIARGADSCVDGAVLAAGKVVDAAKPLTATARSLCPPRALIDCLPAPLVCAPRAPARRAPRPAAPRQQTATNAVIAAAAARTPKRKSQRGLIDL